jgi:betaine lipid synthase
LLTHESVFLSVLHSLESESLTKIIVMDSLDWFDPIPESQALPQTRRSTEDVSPEIELEHLRSELDYEILEMKRVLKVGGHGIFRSAGKVPWYTKRFEKAGFKVEPVDIRENGQAIDRVNMYASLWRAEKLA